MRIHALEMPDDLGELRGWLERQLVGVNLAALVAELTAAHGAERGMTTLHDVLGEQLSTIVKQGLSQVPADRIGRLLAHPHVLLELQEHILLEGGSHWQTVAVSSPELDELAARGWKRLSAALPRGDSSPGMVQQPVAVAASTRWYSHPAWFVLATAASLLLAVLVYERNTLQGTPMASAWGWNKPGVLESSQSAPSYLKSLAGAAQEWFDARPSDAPAVARRILEFRQGCATLLLSEHKPLSADDKAWLLERCSAWAAKLDSQLVALEAGGDPLLVRSEVDGIARKLITR